MKTAVLVTPLTVTIPIIKDADYIGVDAGCIKILKQGLKLAFGVGDFDSMDPETFEKMKNISNLVIHPVRKNETDSELALEKSGAYFYGLNIYLAHMFFMDRSSFEQKSS